jgi:hypothetical protein
MPPKSKSTAKKLYKATPKIYGYFKLKDQNNLDEAEYNSVYDILKEEITNMYPTYYKSLLIKNINKNSEWVGSLTLNLQEAGKDLSQEQFNHIVRIINKQSDKLQYIKLFYVSTNEPNGVKYTFTNYVKQEKDDKPIPHIFFFCETNDISINNLKQQVQMILKEDYMDAFAIVNKNKSDYNSDGGYFIKVRLNNQIEDKIFKQVSETIRTYFKDNYSEDNIKTYYKTGSETNNKRYTATYPVANTKFVQDE